jgi:acetyl esterase/lipase
MSHASFLLAVVFGADPAEVRLWEGKAPGPTSTDPKNVPTLAIHLAPADKAGGAAVVVCPGGGYSGRATDHEGKQVADWLTARGVHAFILKYRTVNESQITPPLEPGPMRDVQQAIRTVRGKAKDYGVDPKRVGVWGFSAGGHLASTAATRFDTGHKDIRDPIDSQSCRPDFAILAYPVISMKDGVTHSGSKRNLLGPKPDPELVEYYSNELQVTKDTPPTFLFHTDADTAVLPENSILFYQALKKHKVPAELHIFEKGVHGVGLGTDPKWTKGEKGVAAWPERLEAWMKGRGLLEKK